MDFTEPAIPISGDDPISQISQGLEQRYPHQGQHETAASKARQERQERIEPAAKLTVGPNQERHIGTAGTVLSPQIPRRFLALIRNEPDG